MFKTELKDVAQKEIDKMIGSAARLRKLSANEYSGWADFVRLLDDYVCSLLEHKKGFNLSMASDEQINQLKLYDRDVWLINNFIRKIPQAFIKNLEEAVKRQKEEEANAK